MRAMTGADVDHVLAHYQGLQQRSYFYLSSLHGYSRSELLAMLDDGDARQWISRSPEFLVSVHGVDQAQGHARIQLFSRDQSVDLGAAVPAMMRSLRVTRLYSYVFPDEVLEQSSLTAMGFEREAVFRSHVFKNGLYQDVLVYGLTGVPA